MPPPTHRPRARALMEPLEPRILYSADLAAVAGLEGAVSPQHELRLLDTPVSAGASTTTTTTTEIAFVDRGLPQAETLVSGLMAQRTQGRAIEVITFTRGDDGLALVSQTLAQRQAEGVRFDAVHLISHGQAGAVQLGSATLDADSLLLRAGEIAGWSGALGARADLLLYGCDVAAQASGLFLVEGLAALTGADVAASDDPTGSAALGGDWQLEQHTGSIESAVAFGVAVQQDWAGTLGNELPVNLTTGGNQNTSAETRGSQQAVAMDAAGNYTVVWTSPEGDGGGKGVFARTFAFDGTPLTGEIRVNTTTDKDQENARIVGDSAGRFAVVWTSKDQDGTGASVYFRRFAADGTALTGEIRANASNAGDQHNAGIAMNGSNGDVVVAWEGDGPGGQSVFFRRFAQDGTALDSVDRLVVAAGSLNGEHDPAVAMNASGQFVVAWAMGDHVYCQQFDSAGVASGSQVQMDTNIGDGIGSSPSIAINASGDFIGVYRKDVANVGLWVCTQATFWGSTVEVRQSIASGDATSGSVGIGVDGSAVVTYQMTGDGDKLGIYARKLNASKGVEGAAFLVNQTTANDQMSASVAAHDMDRFVVAWSGGGVADNDGVYARTFAPANTAPLITTNGSTATAATSVPENTTAVTTVGANDANWPVQTVTYTIVGGADQAKFALDGQSGALRFLVAPNFENPSDAGLDNVYDVVVQASDGLLGSTQALAVTVTDVDDQVHALADTATTPYRTPVTVDVLANDQRGTGAALTVLDVSQPVHGSAQVVGNQVVYTPESGFVGTDTLRYRVVDGSEGLQAFWALDDVVSSLPTNPVSTVGVMGQALAFDGVDDAMVLSGVTYGSEFTLAFWFKVASNSGTGYQSFYAHGAAGTPHSLNVYLIEDGTVDTTQNNQLRTALVDGNDSGTASALALLDVDVTAAGLADNQWHLYTLSTQAGVGSSVYIDGVFRVSSSHGGSALTPTGTDVVIGGNSTLSATSFHSGSLDDIQLYQRRLGGAEVVNLLEGPGDVATVTVSVTPVNDHAPVIGSDGGAGTAMLNLSENTAALTTLVASDADVGGPALVYTLVGGEDQALFSLDSASGVLRFLAAPDAEAPADAGADNVYYVEVQVSDGVHVDTQSIRVQVTDVNEHAITAVADADPVLDEVDENAANGTLTGLTARARDADWTDSTIVYALDDAAGGRFAIDRDTGVVTVAARELLDAEDATLHAIDVRATSSDGSFQVQRYVLTVRDLDEFDVSALLDADGASDTVREDAMSGTPVGITALARDDDHGNSTVTYALSDDAGGRFEIDATRGVLTLIGVLDAEAALVHTVVVQARSTDGSLSSQSFTVSVQDVNERGISAVSDVDAAAETVREDVAVGTAVGFQAQAVDGDVSANTVTYTLDDTAGARFEVDPATGVLRVAQALDAEEALNHTVVVRATSADGSFTTRSVVVSVQDVDEFDVTVPVDALADPDVVNDNANPGATVGIMASARDTDTSLARITYFLADSAGGRFDIDADTGVVTLARSITDDGDSTQTLVVQATSADGSVATQTMTVTVNRTNLHAPVIRSDGGGDTAALVVAEGTGGVITTLEATDADVSGVPPTYQIVGGADAARFTLDVTTGAVRFVTAPDAEVPLDVGADNQYEVIVQASDGTFADTQTLTVAVRDVNEFALAAGVDADVAADQVPENAAVGTTVGVQVLAVDRDATDNTITYTLDDSAAGRFTVDARTGVVTVAQESRLDAEAAQQHVLVVRATSADGSAATHTLVIAVGDVDESPVGAIVDSDARADSVREDDPVGTVVGLTAQALDPDLTTSTILYTLDDDAGGRFAIDARSGLVTLVRSLDAEVALQHDIVVRARSDDGSAQTRRFTVAVRDVDEFDVAAIGDGDGDAADAVVAENAGVGMPVGITAQALDADASTYAITYTLDSSAGGRFSVDATTGVVRVAGPLDAETALAHTLVVRATSQDGSTRTQVHTVAVADVDEFDLVAMADVDGAANTVQENAAFGTPVGLRVQSVDADVTTQAVRYALVDGAGGRFAVDADTGLVTVAGLIDAEAAQTHTLVVEARSADGSRWTESYQIQVGDVDEFDLLTLTDGDGAVDAVAEDAAVGTPVGLRAHSVDADITPLGVAYTLDDAAGGRFTVDAATGTVTLARTVLEEGITAHRIVLRATSGDGSTVTAAFVVAVLPVNGQVPVIESDGGADQAALDIAEGQTAVTQVQARDADLPAETLRYAVVGGADAAAFSLDAVTGVLRFVVAPDAERPDDQGGDNAYDVTVQVSDGLHTDEQALHITVQPRNDNAPVITSDGGGAAAVLAVDENTLQVTQAQARDADVPADALVWRLAGGADAALFTLEADTGVLRWRMAPDHEQPLDADGDGVYALTLQVSDGLHAASQSLAVSVRDVDEAPRLDVATLTVAEGGSGVPVLQSWDPDTAASALVYTVQALTGGQFEQVHTPGVAVTHFTQAEVRAGDLRFVADGGEAAPVVRLVLSDSRTALAPTALQVVFTRVNDAPVPGDVLLAVVEEDTARLVTADALLAGTRDADGDALTVTALRPVAGEGTLTDLGGGRWRFDPAADWHGTATFTAEVGDGQTSTTLTATLPVRAVNDAPRWIDPDGTQGSAMRVGELAENSVAVTTLVALDPEGVTALRYAVVGGADAALFQIDVATGALSFRVQPDHEQPSDVDRDGRYEVTVEVSDGEMTAQQALQIQVTNVDEAPRVHRNVLLLTDDTVTLVLQASDPDTPATALVYRVEQVEGGQFERASVPDVAVQVFTQAELDVAEVVWVAPSGRSSALFALRLSDGQSEILVSSPTLERQQQTLSTPPVALSPTTSTEVADEARTSVTLATVTANRASPAGLPMSVPLSAGDGVLGQGPGVVDDTGFGVVRFQAPDRVALDARSVAARTAAVVLAEVPELVLTLLADASPASPWLVGDLDLWGSRSGVLLVEQMDRLRQEVTEAQQTGVLSLASTALVSTGLSVGYVVWLVRGGVLMTSLMSAVPAWAGMDPLPVLAEMGRGDGDGGDEDSADDPIEKLFSKARRLLVRPELPQPSPGGPEIPPCA